MTKPTSKDSVTAEKYAISNIHPTYFVIRGEGLELLRINLDGTVTGEIEDASEAARIFVAEVRRQLDPMRAESWRDIADRNLSSAVAERRLKLKATAENERLWEALAGARADIDYACTAIMKLHEHKARTRLEQTLLRIAALSTAKAERDQKDGASASPTGLSSLRDEAVPSSPKASIPLREGEK